MPGRTPPDAVRAFVDPLQQAVACLGPGKISLSPGGMSPGAIRAWTLNEGKGMVAAGGWHFEGEMQYELIRDDTRAWRVTTHAYRYRVAVTGLDVFRIHWHPHGNSPYKRPHVHARFCLPGHESDVIDQHMPTGRITFEEAMEWAIRAGMPAARTDWESVLRECRKKHIEHRSWSYEPPSVDG